MRRRRFLAVTTLSLGLAGCSSSSDSGATRLGHVAIANRHEGSHTVDFRVEWDDEVVHDRSYELPSYDSTPDVPTSVPERTWPEEPGQFRVLARADGGEWRTADPAGSDYPSCFGVFVEIDREGRLSIFTASDSYECSDEAISRGRPSTETSA